MRVVRAVLLWFASVAPLREVVRLETAAPKGKPPAPSMPLLTGAVRTNGVSPGLRGFRNCGALLCSEKLHFLNDDVQRRTLHRADIHCAGFMATVSCQSVCPAVSARLRLTVNWALMPMALGFAKITHCAWPLLSRALSLSELQQCLSGSDLLRVYSLLQKGSQPRGRSWLARPSSCNTSSSRSRVILPIAVRPTPRKVFGRSFAFCGRMVNNNS